VKIWTFVAICFIPLFISPVFGDSEQIEKIISDYRLKGDAYDSIGHSYMAFLNYDEANYQSGKDKHYNKLEEYKNFLKVTEESIEKFGGGNFANIINRSWEIGDYQTTLKYSDIATEKNPSWIAYQNKVRALIFLGRQNEALVTFEKLSDTGHFAQWSSAHIGGKINLLYATGNYEGVLELFEMWVDYSKSRGGFGLPPGDTTMTIAMAYEKTGNPHSAKYWYDQASSPYFEIECLKISSLFSMGLHQEVVEVSESNNTLEKCSRTFLFLYVISKDIITGQYHLPLENTVETISENIKSEIVCGEGTIEQNGQCVPDPNYVQNERPLEGGGCLIATAAYGSELASQVQMLREIRDNSLLRTQSGQSFMQVFNQFYYSFSPTVADWERQNPVFKEATKLFITPMISSLSIMTLAEQGSESQVLGLGIFIIALNLGMYIATPTALIWQIRKRTC